MLIAGLFLADVFTDVALGIELILNEFHEWGYLVLGLVILPNAVALAAEVTIWLARIQCEQIQFAFTYPKEVFGSLIRPC